MSDGNAWLNIRFVWWLSCPGGRCVPIRLILFGRSRPLDSALWASLEMTKGREPCRYRSEFRHGFVIDENVTAFIPFFKMYADFHFCSAIDGQSDPSRIPDRPSGLFAGKVLWTISLPLSTPGTACCKSPLDYLLIASDLLST